MNSVRITLELHERPCNIILGYFSKNLIETSFKRTVLYVKHYSYFERNATRKSMHPCRNHRRPAAMSGDRKSESSVETSGINPTIVIMSFPCHVKGPRNILAETKTHNTLHNMS